MMVLKMKKENIWLQKSRKLGSLEKNQMFEVDREFQAL